MEPVSSKIRRPAQATTHPRPNIRLPPDPARISVSAMAMHDDT